MWKFFIQYDRFSYLLLLALIVIGAYAVISIPRESAPEVEIPIGIIQVALPGAQALEVETLITNRIERAVAGVSNIKSITSTSNAGTANITVEFTATTELDTAIDDLNDAVSRVEADLPSEATDPRVTSVDFTDQPIMTVVLSGDKSGSEFLRLAEEVEAEIESIPNINRVSVQGVANREFRVVVDKTALATYALDLTTVTNALQSANTIVPIGSITTNNINYTVTLGNNFETADDIAKTPIARNEATPVLLRDIATIEETVTDGGTITRYSQSGEPAQSAVTLDVYKTSGDDISRIADSVLVTLEKLQKQDHLLANTNVDISLNQGELNENELLRLLSSGLQTVALVLLVVVLAIGWREGLIASIAIPLSFLFGFIGLYFSGNTINFLSLFALILGVGILVDSAIVMVEGINRKMKDDPTIEKREAALATLHEFTTPLTAGTLTTVSMFAGLFVVGGVTGQFIASIPFTLTFVLLASLFVALGIIPLVASLFLRRKQTNALEIKQRAISHRIEDWYRKKLNSILGNTKKERRFLWSLRLGLVVAIILPIIGVVEVIFFPQSDIDYLFVELNLPPGSSKELTDLHIRRVEELIYPYKDVESFITTVGSGSQFGGGGSGEEKANLFILLQEDREQSSTEILTQMTKDFTVLEDLDIAVNQPNNGPPTGAPVAITLKGQDLDALEDAAVRATQILRKNAGVTSVNSETANSNLQFELTLDPEVSAAYGVTALQLSSYLRTAVYGSEATSINTINDDIPVKVQLSETTEMNSINDVMRTSVPSPTGPVLVSEVTNLNLNQVLPQITHKDRERAITIEANITNSANAREIQNQVVTDLEGDSEFPANVTIQAGGETDEADTAFADLFLALIVGIVLMGAILTLQFNSYLHTRYVLSILPYSLIGIFFGLAITGNSLSFTSIMGFIALSGIVVNNAILLIDMMNKERLRLPEKSIREVVIDTSVSRLRPILLTTTTTVIGMIPLTFVDAVWSPFAYAVMFGLLFSVIITLLLIPITYNRKPGKVNS